MSRVYFHSPSGEAELRGTERAWLRGLVGDLAVGMLHLEGLSDNERLRKFIGEDHYLASKDLRGHAWALSYAAAFRMGGMGTRDTALVTCQGRPLSTLSLMLNTALVLGNDQMKLAARIHGQCEIHAWVDGPNRRWLADIMQNGLHSGVYRNGYHYQDRNGTQQWQSMGWENVITLLRARDDEPVVMSYSICDTFPNATVGDHLPPWPKDIPHTHEGYASFTDAQKQERQDAHEAWHDLDAAEQWRISMAGLRASEDELEIRPYDWHGFRFTHELSVLDLIAPDAEERLAAAVKRMGDSTADEEI